MIPSILHFPYRPVRGFTELSQHLVESRRVAEHRAMVHAANAACEALRPLVGMPCRCLSARLEGE